MKFSEINAFNYLLKNQGVSKKDFIDFFAQENSSNEPLAFINVQITLNTIFVTPDKKLFYHDNKKLFIGKIYTNSKNKLFVVETANKSHKVYPVAENYAIDTLSRDFVLFRLSSSDLATILTIVHRFKRKLIGVVVKKQDKMVFLCDDQKFSKSIYVEDEHLVNNDKVLLKDLEEKENHYIGILESIIGNKTDPDIDGKMATSRYDIESRFSDEVMQEVKKISPQIQNTDLKSRKNYTGLNFVTIDGADAKDLDDAIYVEKKADGYRLIVSIADVSHYVQEGTELDQSALSRSTSVYLINSVIPMLPHFLSNNLCSLNPNTIKLTLSIDMKFSLDGRLLSYQVYESYNEIKQRLTYSQVNSYLKKRNVGLLSNKTCNVLDNAYDLFKKIEKNFEKMGFIEFESDEVNIKLSKYNWPIDIILKKQDEAEKLIEFLMLSANRCCADFLQDNDIPGIYRIHKKPNEELFFNALNAIKLLRPNIKIITDKKDLNSKYIQYLVNEFKEDKDNGYLINKLLLKSMDKAIYSYKNVGHFAIGLKRYSHFTSPIRRYADLITHRQIKRFLNKEKNEIDNIDLDNICWQINEKELAAQKCERFYYKLKKAQYLFDHRDEEFIAHISFLSNFGIYLETDKTIEGFIHIRELGKDFFEYLPQQSVIVGRNSKQEFKIGNVKKVYVKYISLFNGNIDFCFNKPSFNNQQPLDKSKFSNKRKKSWKK